MSIRGTLLLLTCLAAFSACKADQACTLVGCVDGLNISFKGTLPATFSLKLKESGKADLTLACPGGSSQYVCMPESVFVSNYTPAEVEVSYTAGDKTVTKSFKPTYASASPNGPKCGPACKQGKVELEI